MVYNSSVVKTIFYAKIGIKCRFLGVLCFLLTRQSFSVLFRVCLGLVPCIPWFQLFIIIIGFYHCDFRFFFYRMMFDVIRHLDRLCVPG